MSRLKFTRSSGSRRFVWFGVLAVLLICAVILNRPMRPTQALISGTMAPDFSTHTLDGAPLTLSSLRGHVILIDFWATWCAPCQMAIPSVEALHERYQAQGLQVVGISTDQGASVKRVSSFVQEMGMKYPISLDPDLNPGLLHVYQADGLPAQYLIDKQGRIRWSESGFSPDDEHKLPVLIEKLLAEPS